MNNYCLGFQRLNVKLAVYKLNYGTKGRKKVNLIRIRLSLSKFKKKERKKDRGAMLSGSLC